MLIQIIIKILTLFNLKNIYQNNKITKKIKNKTL